MRKILLLIVLFGATITGLRAQVGIGTKKPNAAAQLEIKSDSPTTNRGLLIPRVELTSIDMALTGVTKAQMPNSILVFNTKKFTDVTVTPNKEYGIGYYYWSTNNGTAEGDGKWVPLLAGEKKVVNNFFNTVNTNSSTVNYNSASNTLSVNVGNGLKETTAGGKTIVGLGGELSENTTIQLGSFKLNVKGLQTSTVTTDEIVVIDQSSGELKVVKGISHEQIATNNGNNNKVLKTVNGKVEWVPITGTASNSIVQAENGLNISADGKVVLGGDLTKATKITATSTKTLAIDGLQEGAATSTLVVRDADGVLKYVDGVSTEQIKGGPTNAGKILTVDSTGNVTWTNSLGGGSTTNTIDLTNVAGDGLTYSATTGKLNVEAENGIKVDGDKVKLGGKLTEVTEIETEGANTLAIKGLQDGTGNDKLVVTDANGVLKTVSGVTTSQIVGGDANKGKILTVDPTTGVVTWTSLGGSTTNTIDFSGLAGDGLTYSTTTGKLNVEGGNGITVEGDKVNWGGKLTKTATIETTAGNGFEIKPEGGAGNSNVVIKELPDGDEATDKLVVVGPDGKLKQLDPKETATIDYTSTPTTTGRKWTLPATSPGTPQNKEIKEVTFDVNFINSSTVEIFAKLKTLDTALGADSSNLMPISIRAIKAEGPEISITQSGSYEPNTAKTEGYLTLGMSGNGFTVAHNGRYFIVIEYYVK